jgi:oligopeptidase B
VFYTNYDSGHAGSSGRFDFLHEVALEYAFLIDRLADTDHT